MQVQFFQTLSTIVCGGDQVPSNVKQLAALQLKNALHSARNTELRRKQEGWKQIDQETRKQVKMNVSKYHVKREVLYAGVCFHSSYFLSQLLNTLAQQDAAVSRAVAQVCLTSLRPWLVCSSCIYHSLDFL